ERPLRDRFSWARNHRVARLMSRRGEARTYVRVDARGWVYPRSARTLSVLKRRKLVVGIGESVAYRAPFELAVEEHAPALTPILPEHWGHLAQSSARNHVGATDHALPVALLMRRACPSITRDASRNDGGGLVQIRSIPSASTSASLRLIHFRTRTL